LQCRCGICSSPIQLTSSQLTAYNILPTYVTKTLLHPGDALFKRTHFSKYHDGLLRKCEINGAKKKIINYDILQLEIMVGSYLCVCGAFLGLPKRGRVSLFGVLLLWWGLTKQVFYATTPNGGGSGVQIYPLPMLFALIMACLCVRRDVKRILRSFRARYRKSCAKRRSSKTKYVQQKHLGQGFSKEAKPHPPTFAVAQHPKDQEKMSVTRVKGFLVVHQSDVEIGLLAQLSLTFQLPASWLLQLTKPTAEELNKFRIYLQSFCDRVILLAASLTAVFMDIKQ
ncbi:hypothetical protein V2J09_011131, partial [Rumex salicifolius]